MKRILLSLLMITALCWSCEEVVIEETTGNVIGIVADMTTGDPVPVVNLFLEPGGLSTVTGSDGSFAFKDLAEDAYTISFSKKGYKSGKSTVTVHAGTDSDANLLIERIPAVITVDREVLDFGDNASMNTLSFNIVNNNYVDLKYEIIENCPWILDADPKSGDLPFGKTGTIVLTIDRDALQAGVNETTVVVRTAGEGSSELLVRATGIEKRKASLNIQDASDIRSSSVRLNAEITDSGAPAYTERGFVYSENSMPDFNNTIAKVTASVTEEMSFSVKVDGLELGKTYYARAYAVNSVGEAFSSNQISFTTTSLPAAVEITDVSVDENNMNVLLYARITDDGDPKYYEKGFVYSTSNPNPTLSDTKVLVEGDNSGNFETCITDLKFSTDYYFRAYVSNASGTTYSESKNVNVTSSMPIVVTHNATDLDKVHGVAVLHGEITDDGKPKYTEAGFVYSDVYQLPTIYDNKVIVEDVNDSGLFEHRVTDLSGQKPYYFRAYAINAKGISYGEAIKFFQNDWTELPDANLAVQNKDSGKANLKSAQSICNNSMMGGYDDWRLPTLAELNYIYSVSHDIGGFDYSSRYWSSSNYYNNYSYYYYVSFTSGSYDDMFHENEAQVRCVRTLEPVTEE